MHVKNLPRIMLAALPFLAGGAVADQTVILSGPGVVPPPAVMPVPPPVVRPGYAPAPDAERAMLRHEILERMQRIQILRGEIHERMLRLPPGERQELMRQMRMHRPPRPGFGPPPGLAPQPTYAPEPGMPPQGYGRGFEERNPR